ncbi:glycoside hydrolase family 15 protein [Pseudomonas sp. NCHU5208]|uniref:glycoside hydrolase family 15 protein n=1 Tax=unclassified Pseudomonas TaxID=196821 RepID=UPI003F95995A
MPCNPLRHQPYPDLGSLAALGDGRSLALVSTDGAVEWLCPNRFDAAPLFWSLLDRQRGGFLRLRPCSAQARVHSRYRQDSAVLEQDWHTPQGACRVTLCMQWPPAAGRQSLLWLVEGLAGQLTLDLAFAPRADFGRAASPAQAVDGALQMRWNARWLCLQAPGEWQMHDGDWHSQLRVEAGQRLALRLDLGDTGEISAPPLDVAALVDDIAATTQAWHGWVGHIGWTGPYREPVVRSAITLKLLIYQPTGAVVAAGTTSLPEAPGGSRNWDYRFTWFRDAGFTLAALFALGCRSEAHAWASWMEATIERHGMPLRNFYDLDGCLPPGERLLDALQGYRGARPVRVGNAADAQFQLDIYGELLQSVYICDTMADDALHSHWAYLREAADFIAGHWRQADEGIWEVRSAPRHFVHSKVMAWTGLQRALWLQQRHGLEADVQRWRRESEQLRSEVLRHGLNAERSHFVRDYGGDGLDANLLLLARTGFIDGHSELFRNTVQAVRRALAIEDRPWLLRRYHRQDPDGLPGEEGAFVICSFWLVDALATSGAQAEAEALFEQLLALQGGHGLLAEEVDPRNGQQLGNLPQAYSHVGLINAALRLRFGPRIPGETSPLQQRSKG